MDEGENLHFSLPGSSKKKKAKNKGKGKLEPTSNIKKESKYFFCKKKGHMEKDCWKHREWLARKGNFNSFVCFESNLTNVCHNTWWMDSGSTIHVSNTLQGMRNLRKSVGSKCYIHSGWRLSSNVEAIRTCSLELSSGYVLQLEKTFYVTSFSRNLISVSALVPLGISCNFQDSSFSLLIKSKVIRKGTLRDGLYIVQLQNNYNSLSIIVGTKRCIMNEDSSFLWHKRLGHISIQRIKRLVNEGVLSALNFIDFETCVDCIKGKQTNKSKKGATRSEHLLGLIHTDICCLDMDGSNPRYLFIDDFSCYMYLYMLHSKDEALEAFKVFKARVEKQYGKQIKVVRSDRSGEYYE